MSKINESTEASASVLETYDKLCEVYLSTNSSEEEKTVKLVEFNKLKAAAVFEADPDKLEAIKEIYHAYIDATSELANKSSELKVSNDNDTGFIDDVRIAGKFNDRDVADYVLREELDEKTDVDHQ